MSKYECLVPHIKERLILHHNLYKSQCKAEYWEEHCAYALDEVGMGSDWQADFNHLVGIDMVSNDGVGISNKGGKLNKAHSSMTISGSRLTKHKTLDAKLEFLRHKVEDVIFCLATDAIEWDAGERNYYFIVVDANTLDYHNQQWEETFQKKEPTISTGFKCLAENYSASIKKPMSDQLWTIISSELFVEMHKIVIDK